MATVPVAVAVWVSVNVGLAEVNTVALGLAVAVADDDGVEVADTLADTLAVGVTEVVADATRVGVAVGAAWPAAAGGGSNPQSRPATSRTGITIRLINGIMHFSTEVDPRQVRKVVSAQSYIHPVISVRSCWHELAW